jgi:predicted O-methyltransferase YrrM
MDRMIEEIYRTASPDLLRSAISLAEGDFLQRILSENDLTRSIEVGCANGLSSLFICEALSKKTAPSHTILDPFQTSEFRRSGVKKLDLAGYDFYTLIEEGSETALPALLKAGAEFDFGFVDGSHTFDHTMLDLFYLNRLIRVNGFIVLDDVDMRGVNRAARYLATYPCYRIVATVKKEGPRRRRLNMCKLLVAASLRPFVSLAGQSLSFEFLDSSLIRPRIIRDLDSSSMVAFQKVAEDRRSHIWYDYI